MPLQLDLKPVGHGHQQISKANHLRNKTMLNKTNLRRDFLSCCRDESGALAPRKTTKNNMSPILLSYDVI